MYFYIKLFTSFISLQRFLSSCVYMFFHLYSIINIFLSLEFFKLEDIIKKEHQNIFMIFIYKYKIYIEKSNAKVNGNIHSVLKGYINVYDSSIQFVETGDFSLESEPRETQKIPSIIVNVVQRVIENNSFNCVKEIAFLK